MKSKRKNSTMVGFFFVADYQWAIYLHHRREPKQFTGTTMRATKDNKRWQNRDVAHIIVV